VKGLIILQNNEGVLIVHKQLVRGRQKIKQTMGEMRKIATLFEISSRSLK
jgi:hypothetical protein